MGKAYVPVEEDSVWSINRGSFDVHEELNLVYYLMHGLFFLSIPPFSPSYKPNFIGSHT